MHCFQLHKLYNKSNYIEVYLLYEEFEYTKRASRFRKSKKDRHHNGQQKKDNRTIKVLQNTTQKTKDRAT